MNALTQILLRRIRAGGPMTIADFMSECLLNPRHGYYATREPFGAGGDFITAPEISQMFGEMLGLALAQCWLDQGRPAPFTLAELGPGRGTLMADILRATAGVPGFAAAARVFLIEASDRLRCIQAETLSGHEVAWCAAAAELPEAPLFVVANEFFDALPIRQFVRDGDGWRERHVGADETGLCLGLAPATPLASLAGRLADTRDGDLVEICPAAGPVMSELGRRIARHGGCTLIVDYGGWRSLGDTLQAVRGHKPVGIFDAPGECDLTAHVDFEALARAALPARASGPIGQGEYLERLGITPRAQALARGLQGPALENHVAAHRRLTHPDEMGTLFKVLGILPPGAPPLPGFPHDA